MNYENLNGVVRLAAGLKETQRVRQLTSTETLQLEGAIDLLASGKLGQRGKQAAAELRTASRHPGAAARPARAGRRAFIGETEDGWWDDHGRLAVLVEQLCVRSGIGLNPREQRGTRLRRLDRHLRELTDSPARRDYLRTLNSALAEAAEHDRELDSAYASLARQKAA